MAQITFHTADIKFRLLNVRKYADFIAVQVKKATGGKVVLTYVFCSDKYLLEMNKQFLQHDYYTDIITFDLGEKSSGSKSHEPRELNGEIYISIDRVKENAAGLNVPFADELSRVIFHGVLHLLGFKDKTKAQKQQMREAEDAWIRAFRRKLATKKRLTRKTR
ncbi:MAG: rRNA maturation RNase YbeY [Chitinophagales bacterium]